AIIGAGVMGANHGRVARSIREFTVTSVCDPDSARAAAVAAPLGAA
ncbi:MAG TPA: oxidoreductase, partial [Micromonosporaceae bacterium]|nr:oxidoreductase [Micromonosporaceae bacterium]